MQDERPTLFFDERIITDPGWFETAADLYAAYLRWCCCTVSRPVSVTAFGRALKQRGFSSRRGHIVTWLGLRLHSQ